MSGESNNSTPIDISRIVQILLLSLILGCVFIQDAVSQKQISQTVINQNKRLLVHQNNEILLHRNQDGLSRCATSQMEAIQFGPDVNKVRSSRESFVSKALRTRNGNADILEIPVVFHIIHDGDEIGVGENIDAIFITEQLKQANNDFRKIAGTTGDGLGVDTGIEFVLATVDPLGNVMPEPGINRINIDRLLGSGPYDIPTVEAVIKPSTIWNPLLYFNSWTIDMAGGILGYAQFPESPELEGIGMGPLTDGVVVRYTTVGSTEFTFPQGAPFNAGRTWTHEAGHFFGLIHIWGNGDCTVDDFCSDTPNAAEPSTGCPQRDTCPLDPGDDQPQNYMDYSDDACMNIFSACQSERMRAFLGANGEGSVRRVSLVNSPVGITDGVVLLMNKPEVRTCYEYAALYDFTMTFIGAGTEDVILSVSDLPQGIKASFSEDTIVSSGHYSLTLDNLELLVPDNYQFTLSAVDQDGNQFDQSISLNVDFLVTNSPSLIKPVNQSDPINLPAVFEWTPVTFATEYDIQIATDSDFLEIVETGQGLEEIQYTSRLLEASQNYFWRVRGVSACLPGPWSETQSFITDVVSPCPDFAIGPFIDFNEISCYPKCEQKITLSEQVWANESYLINGLSEGAEYIFEFCDGYDPNRWSATITVTDVDNQIIASSTGCSLTFNSTISGSILVIISDDCGGEFRESNNGFPSISCTGNGVALPVSCRSCFVDEDFESGMPVDWSHSVTGDGNQTNWIVDNHPFAFFIFTGYLANNPGSGNWLYYDDDANGPSVVPNLATVKTATYDLSGIEGVALSFDYDYIDQGFNSKVFLSISDGDKEFFYNGFSWIAENDSWLDSDSRGTFSELIPLSLDAESISVSFTYDDGLQWAWGIGIDNFALCGNCASFDELEAICENAIPPVLPNTSLNGITGTWNPAAINTSIIGVRTHMFTPDIQSSCNNFALNVKIEAVDDASFVYSDNVLCKGMANPVPIITGHDNGTFSSDGPIEIDPSSGRINLSMTETGVYEIKYTTNGPCQSSDSQVVEILPVFECPLIIPENLIASQNFLRFGDPCQCDDSNNCVSRITGQTFIHDTIRIPAVGSITAGLDIRIADATGFYTQVDCQNNIFELPTFGSTEATRIPEVSPGVYKIAFWKTTKEKTTLSIVSGNSNQIAVPVSVFPESCDCFIPIPTLGEWALICLALLLLIVSTVRIQEMIIVQVPE